MSKPRRACLTFEKFLLELGLRDLNFHRLVDLFVVAAFVIGIVLDSGGEECVNKGRFTQTGLASYLRALLV